MHINGPLDQASVITWFVKCEFSLEMLDLKEEGVVEKIYTLEQGITRQNLPLGEATLTLTQIYLLTLELNMPDDEKEELWTRVFNIALIGGPGLFA